MLPNCAKAMLKAQEMESNIWISHPHSLTISEDCLPAFDSHFWIQSLTLKWWQKTTPILYNRCQCSPPLADYPKVM